MSRNASTDELYFVTLTVADWICRVVYEYLV